MQANRLPAARGYAWIIEAGGLCKRSPLVLAASVLSFWMFLLVLALIPLLGTIAIAAVMPIMSVGLYRIYRNVEVQRPAHPAQLLSAPRARWLPLAILGGINFVLSMACVHLASLIDGGTLLAMMQGKAQIKPETLDQPGVFETALVMWLLSSLLMMANWFAPLLVGLRDLSPGKALFFSFVACWRNLRPLVVFASTYFMIFAILPSLLIGLIPPLAVVVVGVLPLVALPIFYGAFNACVKDVFGDLD